MNFLKFEHWHGQAWNMSRCFGRLAIFLVYHYFRFPRPVWLYHLLLLLFTISLDIILFLLMTFTIRMEGQSKILVRNRNQGVYCHLENALLSCLDMFLMLTMLLVQPLGYTRLRIPWGSMMASSVLHGILTLTSNAGGMATSSWEEDWDYGTTMRKKINKNEKPMASQEEDKAKKEEKAGRTATNQEEQMQELETKYDENTKTLLNKEEQPDVAAEINCQRDDDKWVDEEQKGMLAELHGAIQLYQEKERKYGELIEKCNQNRNELSREFLDLILQREVSSTEYYRALYVDCYGTCRKVIEQNVSLIEKLCSNTSASADEQRLPEIIDQLEYKCRLLEEDKENLKASIRAANAAAELYRGYLHDSM